MLMRSPTEGDLTPTPPQTPPASVAPMPGNPSFILHLPFPRSSAFQVLSQICSSVALRSRPPRIFFSNISIAVCPRSTCALPLFISLLLSIVSSPLLPIRTSEPTIHAIPFFWRGGNKTESQPRAWQQAPTITGSPAVAVVAPPTSHTEPFGFTMCILLKVLIASPSAVSAAVGGRGEIHFLLFPVIPVWLRATLHANNCDSH